MADVEYWDSDYANGNFKHWEPLHSSPELAALVASGFLRKGARILDVGCGAGLDAIFMVKQGLDVIGVDLSRKALRIARRRATAAEMALELFNANVLDLPLNDETVDFVTDRGLFHLLEDYDRPKYCCEVLRVLKHLGCVVIRGASEHVGGDRFNPITEATVDRFFPRRNWTRGDVVLLPLFSPAGDMEARMVILKKNGEFRG